MSTSSPRLSSAAQMMKLARLVPSDRKMFSSGTFSLRLRVSSRWRLPTRASPGKACSWIDSRARRAARRPRSRNSMLENEKLISTSGGIGLDRPADGRSSGFSAWSSPFTRRRYAPGFLSRVTRKLQFLVGPGRHVDGGQADLALDELADGMGVAPRLFRLAGQQAFSTLVIHAQPAAIALAAGRGQLLQLDGGDLLQVLAGRGA